MRRDQLEHIIRAAAAVTGENEFIVVGSQAILGQYPDAPAPLLISMEADLYDRPPEDDSTDTRHSVFEPRVSKSLTGSEPPRRRCVRAARRSASVVKPWFGKSNQIAMTSSVRWSTPIRPRRRFFHVSLCYRRGRIGDIARRRVPIGDRTPRGAQHREEPDTERSPT